MTPLRIGDGGLNRKELYFLLFKYWIDFFNFEHVLLFIKSKYIPMPHNPNIHC